MGLSQGRALEWGGWPCSDSPCLSQMIGDKHRMSFPETVDEILDVSEDEGEGQECRACAVRDLSPSLPPSLPQPTGQARLELQGLGCSAWQDLAQQSVPGVTVPELPSTHRDGSGAAVSSTEPPVTNTALGGFWPWCLELPGVPGTTLPATGSWAAVAVQGFSTLTLLALQALLMSL